MRKGRVDLDQTVFDLALGVLAEGVDVAVGLSLSNPRIHIIYRQRRHMPHSFLPHPILIIMRFFGQPLLRLCHRCRLPLVAPRLLYHRL
jgi:hypothetical protein